MTANQVVAYNLRRARTLRGWTQAETVKELEPYLGARWSTASYGMAERAADGGRARRFDADELLAFAQAFDLPPTWFLFPPAQTDHPVTQIASDDAPQGLEPAALLARLFKATDELQARFAEFGSDAPPADLRAELDGIADNVIARSLDRYVRGRFSDLDELSGDLLKLADLVQVVASHAAREHQAREQQASGAASPADELMRASESIEPTEEGQG